MNSLLTVLAVFVLRPYVAEAFIMPTNTMAPTILGDIGRHRARVAEAPPTRHPNQAGSDQPVLMICGKERRSCEVADPPRVPHSGDRILVNKLLESATMGHHRVSLAGRSQDRYTAFGSWGCRAKRSPFATARSGSTVRNRRHPNPAKGLSIWITSKVCRALCGAATPNRRVSGPTSTSSWVISRRAKDSRLWQHGAPGHPPYAVPKSYVIGVADCTYWPLSRCAWLR